MAVPFWPEDKSYHYLQRELVQPSAPSSALMHQALRSYGKQQVLNENRM